MNIGKYGVKFTTVITLPNMLLVSVYEILVYSDFAIEVQWTDVLLSPLCLFCDGPNIPFNLDMHNAHAYIHTHAHTRAHIIYIHSI